MKRGLEAAAVMFLESIKPISFIGSQFSMVLVAPYLSIFGDMGIDYIKFFEKRENVERLLKRLEDEIKVRDEDKQKAKVQKRFGIKCIRLTIPAKKARNCRRTLYLRTGTNRI
jgi:hypothetical protein